MAHLYFQVEVLERFCRDAFRKFGFSEEESRIITDVLLMSDQYGIESHGMQELMREFAGVPVGLSDHTKNNTACIAAMALGAGLVERHFTDRMSRRGPGKSGRRSMRRCWERQRPAISGRMCSWKEA